MWTDIHRQDTSVVSIFAPWEIWFERKEEINKLFPERTVTLSSTEVLQRCPVYVTSHVAKIEIFNYDSDIIGQIYLSDNGEKMEVLWVSTSVYRVERSMVQNKKLIRVVEMSIPNL